MLPEHQSYKVRSPKTLGVSPFFQETQCSEWSISNYFAYARNSDPRIKYTTAKRLFKLYSTRLIQCDKIPNEVKCYLGNKRNENEKNRNDQENGLVVYNHGILVSRNTNCDIALNSEGTRKLKTKNKSFTLQSPKNVVSPNTPIIDKENMSLINANTDMCLSTDYSYASPEALEEYNRINTEHDENKFFNAVPGANDLFNEIKQLPQDGLLESIAALTYQENLFNRFMKFAFIDFAINCERLTPTPMNDERTIFFENVLPIFKYFGNITKSLSFRWGEKKNKDSALAVYYVNQNKGETRLMDGFGSNQNGNGLMMIESSGYKEIQDIEHTREDSIKNLVSATDILLSTLCKYDKASFETVKKLHVYSFHVIRKKLTLTQYSIKNRATWRAIECGSAEVPLLYTERKKMIKLLDLFAFIYDDIKNQEKIIEQLEDENFGLTKVDPADRIKPMAKYCGVLV